jgi:ribosome-associated protein
MRDFSDILKEVSYKTSRSGGAGGQHVNKVETKVAVIFHVANSQFLNENEKERLLKKLHSRIDSEGNLQIVAQESRSQHKNKALAEKKLLTLIEEALKEQKKRKPTKVSKAAHEKRLKVKRIQSENKANRKPFRF